MKKVEALFQLIQSDTSITILIKDSKGGKAHVTLQIHLALHAALTFAGFWNNPFHPFSTSSLDWGTQKNRKKSRYLETWSNSNLPKNTTLVVQRKNLSVFITSGGYLQDCMLFSVYQSKPNLESGKTWIMQGNIATFATPPEPQTIPPPNYERNPRRACW